MLAHLQAAPVEPSLARSRLHSPPSPPPQRKLFRAAVPSSNLHSAYEAQASQAKVEHKQRVDGDGHAVLDHPAPSENAYTSRQRPGDKDQIDWYACNPVQLESGHKCRDDEREQRITNDADALREGTSRPS